MRLISLVTTHFKKLGSVTLNFTTGLNVLAGDNARGKSSALQAIKCALFGSSMVPGKKEFIPTFGQKKYEVQLTFAVAGDTYLVIRTGTTAKLLRLANSEAANDELVANGTTPVNAAIEELLGLAAKDYGLFIESAQGESTGILTFGATALNRKVEEFAGVDLIDRVQTLAGVKAARLLANSEASRPTIEDAKLVADAHQVAVQELATAADHLEQAEAALAAHGEFTAKAPEADVELMRAQQRDEERLWNELNAAETALNVAKQREEEAAARCAGLTVKCSQEMATALTALKEEGQRKADLLDSIKAEQQKQRKLEEEELRLHGELAQVEKDNEALIAAYDEDGHYRNQAALTDAEQGYNEAMQRAADYQAKVNNLKSLADGAECPTCGHVKEEHDPVALAKELEAAEHDLKDATNRFAAARLTLEELRKAVADGARALQAIQFSSGRCKQVREAWEQASQAVKDLTLVYTPSDEPEAEGALAEARHAYAALQAEMKLVTSNNEQYRSEHATWAIRLREYQEAKDVHATLAARYEALPQPPTNEEIEEAAAARREHESAFSEWKYKKSELITAQTMAKREVEFAQRTEQERAKAVEAIKLRAESADEYEAQAKNYSRLVQFLRERRRQYLEEVWSVVLGVSSKLVREASDGMISQIMNKDGEFYFVEDGIEAPTAGCASGAQKSFIGTALRVGLARALYGSDGLLIFDEPTEACSERNAAGMAAMLASSAKQVLLITHRENDQALAENILNIGE